MPGSDAGCPICFGGGSSTAISNRKCGSAKPQLNLLLCVPLMLAALLAQAPTAEPWSTPSPPSPIPTSPRRPPPRFPQVSDLRSASGGRQSM